MEASNTERVIVLVDMDCFYVQVEQKLCPEYQNKPCAVVQYKTWKGGGIIAVNYEARAKGVTRSMRGDTAQKVCPDIHLFRVPEIREKADLTRYREAGALVLDVLCEYSDCVERASIDEAYLDMTSVISSRIQNAPRVTSEQLQNTFVVGWEGESSESKKIELEKWLQMIYEEEHLYNDRMLALAAVIVEEMRVTVYEKTGYRCSAGIAHNKMLAKLSCGLHKPNKQTVLPQASIQLLFKTMPVKKVRNLGGKLGEAIVKEFNVENMGDLIDKPKFQFVNLFGEKTGNWLYSLVRGIDSESVTSRQLPKSIGCGKNFPGKKSLSSKKDVVHWLKQMATELEERLIKDQNDNRRFARLLTVSVRYFENHLFSVTSRSCPIQVYNAEKLAHDALVCISKLNTSSDDILWKPSIWMLSMAASKFEDRLDTSHCNIESYFTKGNSSANTSCASIATVSTECSNIKQSSDSPSKFLKSVKNQTPDRSIVSYFKKKQSSEIRSFEEVETLETNKNINDENNELDSFLSACNDLNSTDMHNDESNDSDVARASSLIGNTETILPNKQNKLTEILEVKTQSASNSTNFIDTNYESSDKKAEKISTLDGKLETLSPNKQDEPFEFFGKKLKEQSKFTSDLGFEASSDNTKNDFNYAKSDEASDVYGAKTVLSENPSKSLGFFARKLKEKSESDFNFSVEIETSCDSLKNEPEKTDQTEHQKTSNSNAPSVLMHEQNAHSISSGDDIYCNLDPELIKLCEQCNKHIPVWEETEHSDYHLALNMSKEFSNSHKTNNNASVSGKNMAHKSKSSRKRGNASRSSSQAKKPVQTKTIDSFFR